MGTYSKKDSDGKNIGYVIAAVAGGAFAVGAAVGVGICYLYQQIKRKKQLTEETKVQNAHSIPLPFPRPTGPKCNICQKEIDKRDRITLGCNHPFHLNCYKALLDNAQSRCPILSCRKSSVE